MKYDSAMPVSGQRRPPAEACTPGPEESTRDGTGACEVGAREIIGAHSVVLEHGRVAKVWELRAIDPQLCIDQREGHPVASEVPGVKRLITQPLDHLRHGVLG